MNQRYLTLLQKRLANVAIGASTARGMGPAGTIQSARTYLGGLNLQRFEATTEADFLVTLERATEELCQSMPPGARHWGSARKFLNIFLRDCLYNRYIYEHYALAALEAWLELPLDSHVANALRNRSHGFHLPRWNTVVGLTQQDSFAFQARATEIANIEGTQRVHLDLLFWRSPEDASHVVQQELES